MSQPPSQAVSRQASVVSLKDGAPSIPPSAAAPPTPAPVAEAPAPEQVVVEPGTPAVPPPAQDPAAAGAMSAARPPSRQPSHASLVSGLRQGSTASVRSQVAATPAVPPVQLPDPAASFTKSPSAPPSAAVSRINSVRSIPAEQIPKSPLSPLNATNHSIAASAVASVAAIISPAAVPEPGTPAPASPAVAATLADVVSAEIADPPPSFEASQTPSVQPTEAVPTFEEAVPEGPSVVVQEPEHIDPRELQDAQRKIGSLEATVASLQRLLSSGTNDSKIKVLTKDLEDRGLKIKKLETDLKNERRRAETLEKKLKEASAKKGMKRLTSFRTAASDTGGDQTAQLREEIQQLKRNLSLAKAQANQNGGVAPPVGSRASSVCGNDKFETSLFVDHSHNTNVSELQKRLAESEAEKNVLRAKLSKAQDAIVSAAGSGFENEVKLQQARSALKTILSTQSSPARSASRSASASPAPAANITAPALPVTAGAGSPPAYAAYTSPTYRHVSPYRQYSASPGRY